MLCCMIAAVKFKRTLMMKVSYYKAADSNSFTTKKQTTKFSSANFQKMLSPSYIILRIKKLEGKQCRSR